MIVQMAIFLAAPKTLHFSFIFILFHSQKRDDNCRRSHDAVYHELAYRKAWWPTAKPNRRTYKSVKKGYSAKMANLQGMTNIKSMKSAWNWWAELRIVDAGLPYNLTSSATLSDVHRQNVVKRRQKNFATHTAIGIPVTHVNMAYATLCVIRIVHKGELFPLFFCSWRPATVEHRKIISAAMTRPDCQSSVFGNEINLTGDDETEKTISYANLGQQTDTMMIRSLPSHCCTTYSSCKRCSRRTRTGDFKEGTHRRCQSHRGRRKATPSKPRYIYSHAR